MIKEYIAYVFLILSCMSIDNLCWMTSSPEWKEKSKTIWTYLRFCGWRIWSVFTDYRDIIPAMLTSACLMILNSNILYGIASLIIVFLVIIKYFWFFGKERNW